MLTEFAEHLKSSKVEAVPLGPLSRTIPAVDQEDVPYMLNYIDTQLKRTEWVDDWIDQKDMDLQHQQLLKSALTETVQKELEQQTERFSRLTRFYARRLKEGHSGGDIVTSKVDLSKTAR